MKATITSSFRFFFFSKPVIIKGFAVAIISLGLLPTWSILQVFTDAPTLFIRINNHMWYLQVTCPQGEEKFMNQMKLSLHCTQHEHCPCSHQKFPWTHLSLGHCPIFFYPLYNQPTSKFALITEDDYRNHFSGSTQPSHFLTYELFHFKKSLGVALIIECSMLELISHHRKMSHLLYIIKARTQMHCCHPRGDL